MPTNQDAWPYYEVVNDSIWSIVSKLTLGAASPSEGDEEAYQTLFRDNNEGDNIFIKA